MPCLDTEPSAKSPSPQPSGYGFQVFIDFRLWTGGEKHGMLRRFWASRIAMHGGREDQETLRHFVSSQPDKIKQ